jgi:hypothetical protein
MTHVIALVTHPKHPIPKSAILQPREILLSLQMDEDLVLQLSLLVLPGIAAPRS